MAERPSWNSAYQGSPPWDVGRPQPDFVRLGEAGELAGQVLEVGCGTGEQVMLAATHGAQAMGVDIAELAIQRAREKAEERAIPATFQVADAMHLDRLGRQFDVITDSGLFHVFSDDERPAFVTSLRPVLWTGGMYSMMCFRDLQLCDLLLRRVSKEKLRD